MRGRNRTKLVDGVLTQVGQVRAVLDAAGYPVVPVRGMLCFVRGDWPMFQGAFTIRGVEILWPGKAIARIRRAGPLTTDRIEMVHRLLATKFPAAVPTDL